ncbi:hypothetical protein N7489_004857 [Penicillium chrysogenum]|uniref:uncharacterized protein n=1 Tax=Penicillium chrysogenum TaxID=5076 RepID=UPI0024DF1CB2|nr:uncharacterized protein N7489_004857 [Penicillium chrysogenum]KAJ5244761.1 hypothetical protein N7489_004857 [Penicillium chrysogenum]
MATLGGAELMNVESLIGSVVPGKKADLVVFRCDDYDTVPVVNPIGTVAFHASPKNIDTVIVDGTLSSVMVSFLLDQAAKVDMEKTELLFLLI